MKHLSITALALFSTSAFATNARVGAHQGNVGISDDVDYRTYFSRTDNGKDSIWFDLAGDVPAAEEAEHEGHEEHEGEDDEDVVDVEAGGDEAGGDEAAAADSGSTLAAAYKADGRSVTLEQSNYGTAVGYYAANGDSGYGIELDVLSKDVFSLGGGYGMTNGKTDIAFGGTLGKGADSIDVLFNVNSRTLKKKEVSAWGAELSMIDKAIEASGSYRMGWRFNTDTSTAAVTVGPNLMVSKPSEGDMDITLRLAEINIAGEFALNDWFGLRGSVVSGLDAILPMAGKEFDVTTDGVSTAFGASLDFEGADIDLMIDPGRVLDGPYFLTGNSSGAFGAMMSARFDI